MIVAGLDEAGYGPKLGPLVVASTAFSVAGAALGDAPCLWELLAPAVRRDGGGPAAKVWVADSKEVKKRKDGLKLLELGALSFRGEARGLTLLAFLAELGAEEAGAPRQPWFEGLPAVKLPAHAWAGEVAARALRLREAGAAAGVTYLGAGARVLDARTFNARVAATGNKADVLGEACASLLRDLRRAHAGPLDVTVDKHGGRNTYLRLLGRAFPLCKLEIEAEGARASAYRIDTSRGPVRVAFRREAETASLPAALASMHCKYLRELFMDQFNAWFAVRLPDVRRTAGYAEDAGRWLAEVSPSLAGLGISLEELVRLR